MKFQELKINQEFRTSNGRPAVKVSQDSAKSLVPVCVSPSTNQYEENLVFSMKPSDSVYVVKNVSNLIHRLPHSFGIGDVTYDSIDFLRSLVRDFDSRPEYLNTDKSIEQLVDEYTAYRNGECDLDGEPFGKPTFEERFANAQYELQNQGRLDYDDISMVAVKISSSNLSNEGKVNAIEGLLKVQQFWSRRCDESGEGFDDGWLMGDDIYLKYEKDVDGYLIEWATLDGYEYDDIEELKEYYHDNESYYYTEWDFSYELMNETFYLELSTGDVVSWDEYLESHEVK